MQRNMDQKEQNRRNSDVDVRLDVAAVRHFSDTIQKPFAHSLSESNVNLSTLSRLIGAIIRSEDSSVLHGDAVPILRIQQQRQVSSSTHDQIVNARSDPERFLAHIHNSSCRSEEISTNQQWQVFRRNHAENDSALLASNKKTGAVTLVEETSVPPSPNVYLSASRVSSISCFRPSLPASS